jgi:hypothetical protein
MYKEVFDVSVTGVEKMMSLSFTNEYKIGHVTKINQSNGQNKV